MKILTKSELQAQLTRICEWRFHENALVRDCIFENFTDAMVFVNQIAQMAEEEVHHPDIRIFSYNHVTISITTHDAGGVTKKDCALAALINTLFLEPIK